MSTAVINDVLRSLDREIWLVTSSHGDRRSGLIATFVSNASIVPDMPRVVVGIAKQHHSWGVIEASGEFLMHLLDESHIERVWRFGLQSGHEGDKFAGLDVRVGQGGHPHFSDAPAWLHCKVEASLDIGDRMLYVAAVIDGRQERKTPRLTMRRLIELAPPERLRELRDGLARDAQVDAAAILAWRTTFRS
ncbi:MAG: flavin reductase family protein [Gemmataceae bacterium]|nr:flavin reductase family protein [Gemmataceae bacterium]